MATRARRRRVTVRRKNQLTLPAEVASALRIAEGDEVEFTVDPDGDVHLRGLMVVPADQRWFWTDEWQEGEREASREIAAGDTTFHEDIGSMFDELDR